MEESLGEVLVRCGGKEFAAHVAVLSRASDYFSAMFTSGMEESTKREVHLHGMEPEVFVPILEYMYKDVIFDLDGLTSEDVTKLIAASQFLLITSGLEDRCWEVLTPRLNGENWLEYWNYAQYLKNPTVLSGLVDVAAKHFEQVAESHDLNALDVGTLTALLKHIRLKIDSADILADAVKNWVESDYENRAKDFAELLSRINLRLLSQKNLRTFLEYARRKHNLDGPNIFDGVTCGVKYPRKLVEVEGRFSLVYVLGKGENTRLLFCYALEGEASYYRYVCFYQCYFPSERRWSPPLYYDRRAHRQLSLATVSVGNDIYFGELSLFNCQLYKYKPFAGTEFRVASPLKMANRLYTYPISAAVVGNAIYFCTRNLTYGIYKFDVGIESWVEKLPPVYKSKENRHRILSSASTQPEQPDVYVGYLPQLVPTKDALCVVGQYPIGVLAHMHRYDFLTCQWTQLRYHAANSPTTDTTHQQHVSDFLHVPIAKVWYHCETPPSFLKFLIFNFQTDRWTVEHIPTNPSSGMLWCVEGGTCYKSWVCDENALHPFNVETGRWGTPISHPGEVADGPIPDADLSQGDGDRTTFVRNDSTRFSFSRFHSRFRAFLSRGVLANKFTCGR